MGNGTQGCPCQCHWDLGWIKFGDTRINFSDVDGLFVVERRGKFLFLETKGPTEELTVGQQILLDQLSRVRGFTVLEVRGPKGFPDQFRQWTSGVPSDYVETDREDFQRRITEWFNRVNTF